MLLGCIGDDFTGSTDLANMLVRGGLRTLQTIGVPGAPLAGADDADAFDACVVALKSRTTPPAAAVAESLAALRWLREQGCRQFFFKYCSTFDSTTAGNIGPVTDALMDALAGLPGADFTIACPAFPENGRTIFRGHLFVGDALLSESGMKDHPLTPMTDANLVRVLQPQTRRKVGLIRFDSVAAGVAAIRERIAALRRDGIGIAIVDAVTNDDLEAIAEACAGLPLVTAGSGIGLGLAAYFRKSGFARGSADAAFVPSVDGRAAIVSGSCSEATNAQVAEWLKTRRGFRIDPLRIAAGDDVAAHALTWASARPAGEPLLFYATSDPSTVKSIQSQLGAERAGALTESALARIATALVRDGVRKLVVAGGETSGAVVKALGVSTMRIGRQIDPGVPWTEASVDLDNRAASGNGSGATRIALALKSGNFGSVDFFDKSLAMLRRVPATMSADATLREALCALGRSLYDRGLTHGSTGNLSVRTRDGWLMTPTGSRLGGLDPARLSRLDGDGRLVDGDPPTKEHFLHRTMYARRPDCNAVVHLHSTHSVAVSVLADVDQDNVLPPLTAYYVMRVGSLPLVPYFAPGDTALAEAVGAYAGRHHALLLSNHGPVVAGTSLSAAADAIEELEATAKLYLLLQGHRVRALTADAVAALRLRDASK